MECQLKFCLFLSGKVLSTMDDSGGGALYVGSTDTNTEAVLVVRDTNFVDNGAGYGGGALLVDTLAELEMELVVINGSDTIAGPGE